MTTKSIAIIGASSNRSKFGNKAVRAYINQQWTVWPINPKASEIEGLQSYTGLDALPDRPERIGLYVPPAIASKVIAQIHEMYPENCPQIWLNPGVADGQVFELVEQLGVNYVNGCAIVDIGESPSSYPG